MQLLFTLSGYTATKQLHRSRNYYVGIKNKNFSITVAMVVAVQGQSSWQVLAIEFVGPVDCFPER